MSTRDPFRGDLLLVLLVAATAVAAIAGLRLAERSGRPPPAAPRPNVLLVGIDTVRVDALGAYGSPAACTSTIGRLAQRGTLFERMLAQAPVTGPFSLPARDQAVPEALGYIQ